MALSNLRTDWMFGTMQKIADSVDYKMPATIDDPAILDEISDALKQIGYAR